jgi:hypothetical protein
VNAIHLKVRARNANTPLGLAVYWLIRSPGTSQVCMAAGTNKRCEGSMNLVQRALLQTGSDTPRICRQVMECLILLSNRPSWISA